MASKVNTRFILIVALALGAALALLAGVYVLKLRGDATRAFRRGQEAMTAGDYKAAYDYFGRALYKDPANPTYLENALAALQKTVPQTQNQANESYQSYLALLGHRALHNPSAADAHLLVLRELHNWARSANDERSWQTLLAAADNMQLRVEDSDRQKPLAQVYRALAIGRLASSESDDRILQAIDEVDRAAAMLAADPNQQAWGADLAQSARIALRASWLNKMQVSGQSNTSIQSQRDALAIAAAQAIERAPQGPETARAYLTWLMMAMQDPSATAQPSTSSAASSATGESSSPPASTSDASAPTPEQLRAAAEHLFKTVNAQSSPGLINESAAILEFIPDVGRAWASTLLSAAAAANPSRQDYVLTLARLQMSQDQLDQSESSLESILNATPLPVCFEAMQQFILKQQAGSLLGDLAYRRWEKSTPADRPAAITAMQAARDRLAGLVPDATNNLMLTRADGKIAFAKGDYAGAAQHFERIVRDTDSRDPEMLSFAAISLEQIGQIGLAHERMSRAVEFNPNYAPWLAAKASMELRMGQVQQAMRTIDPIPDTALADPRVQQVVSLVRRTGAAGGASPAGASNASSAVSSDPDQVAIAAAQDALDKNEIESARATLLGALQQRQDSVALLGAIAQLEIRAGNRAAALPYVERGLKVEQNNTLLNQLSAGLRFDDPIQATLEFYKATVADERQRAVMSLVSLANLANSQGEAAAQLDRQQNAAEAAKARDLATRAQAEAATQAEALSKLAPESAELLEFQFTNALRDKNWARAGEILAVMKRLDLDHAGGLLYQGRLDLAQERTQDAIAALEAATDKLSFSSYAWRALAFAYQAAGNFPQAERAFEQAYRCNPNDIANARAYLALLNRRGDRSRALQILQSVHRLAPQDVSLREAWLTLEAEVGDTAVAMRERSRIFEQTPGDRENAVSLAMLLVNAEPTSRTMFDAKGDLMYSPQRWAAMDSATQEAAIMEARQKWDASIKQIIDQLTSQQGEDLRVAVLQATISRAHGDILGGETLLRDFIARHDKAKQTEDMYVELGRYQAQVSHFNDALESLKQAVALGGSKQREAELNLGLLQMQLGRYDEAVKTLESVVAKQDDQNVRLQIVECLVNLQQFDEAQKRLAEVASGSGGSVPILLEASIARGRGMALVGKGQIAEADAAFATQRELLAKAELQDPTNPLPRVLLAQSFIDEYNRTQKPEVLDDAMVALDRADRIRAGMPQVSIMRVGILKERKDFNGAIAELNRMLAIAPDNLAARRELIQLQVESGNVAAALASVDAAIAKNPTLATWHEFRAQLLASIGGRSGDVVASYSAAYDRAPSVGMLLKLTNAMLATSPPNYRGVADRLAAHPDDLKTEPALREIYARALAGLGNRDQAIEQLRQAYALRAELLKKGEMQPADINAWFFTLSAVFPGDRVAEAESLANELAAGKASAYELAALAGVWMRSGTSGNAAVAKALELQRQALLVCPVELTELRAALNSDLADMLVISGDMKAAGEAYDLVIRLQPANLKALNNLAFLRVEELADPAGALPLAQRLLQLAPGDAGVLDTVGWVYFKNGDLEKARQYLVESLAILSAPDTYVHLAQVQFQAGDALGAEKSLADAEKLKPSDPTQQKIKVLRDDIGKSKGG